MRKNSEIVICDYHLRVVALKDGVEYASLVDLDYLSHISDKRFYVDGGGYCFYNDGKKKRFLHHLILGKRDGYVVDHKNEDKLDNRSKNLRYATKSQNGVNSSKIKGYYPIKKKTKSGEQRYCVSLWVNGAKKHIKNCYSEDEAIYERNKARKKYHGEFASII